MTAGHRLSGLDAGMLYLEFEDQPMHGVSVAVLRPDPDDEASRLTVESLRAHVGKLLDRMPAFRWRVLPIPAGLGHPVCVEDPAIDLAAHVVGETLEAPGGQAEFNRLCARTGAWPLDRNRPLWKMTLVDGLDDGRQAVIFNFHHALVDGMTATAIWAMIFSSKDDPVLPVVERSHEPWPSRSRLVLDALATQIRLVAKLPALVVRSVKALRVIREHRANLSVELPQPREPAPACPWGKEVYSNKRFFATAKLSFADVRFIGEVAHVTVTEVMAAVLAGALRRWLGERDLLPERSLEVQIPISLQDRGTTRQVGNNFLAFGTFLATDVDDPWDRLLSIAKTMAAAKEHFAISRYEVGLEWLDVIPQALARPALQRLRARTIGGALPAENVSLSSLPGPSERWVLDGAVVEEVYRTGPPSRGLNAVIFRYADLLTVGLLAVDSPGLVLDDLAEHLHGSFDELVAVARSKVDPSGPTAGERSP